MNEEIIMCDKCGCPAHPCLPCEEVIVMRGNHTDYEYCRLLENILEFGRRKKNRTGVDTIGVFGEQAKFDVCMNAFPILTTKKIFFKAIVHELLWFIKGDTNIKYLVDNDVHIWDDWAYARYKKVVGGPGIGNCVEHGFTKENMPTQDQFIKRIKDDTEFAQRWGELGEGTYGGMWRKFPYFIDSHPDGSQFKTVALGTVDQLTGIINKLKNNPDDRRMIVSSWHPYWIDHCALPPCHCLFHFNTEELTIEERDVLATEEQKSQAASVAIDEYDKEGTYFDELTQLGVPKRRLNLLLYQRSCDTGLGIPYNITSYSLLLAMVSQVVNMSPGIFTHTYGDLHIYENHIDKLKEQLTRTPYQLPKLWLNPHIKSLFDFKYEDIKLIDYKSHPSIKLDIAV